MQSIPFSYMSLTATSLDGAPHAVQVYSDMSAGMWCRHRHLCSIVSQKCRMVVGGSNPVNRMEYDA